MGWSNEIPNPLIIGGGGVAGEIIVYDAVSRVLITIGSGGFTLFKPSSGATLVTLDSSGLTVTGNSIADIADLLLRGISLAPAFPTYTQYLEVDLPGSRQFQLLYNSATNTTEFYSLGVDAINFSEGPSQEFVPVVITNGQVPIGNWQPWRQILFPNLGDFTSAAFASWITGFSVIPVPIWAQDGTATAEIVFRGQPDMITAAGQYNLRLTVDPGTGASSGPTSRITGAANTQFTAMAAWSFPIPAASTGLTVVVQAQLLAGGALRGSAAVSMVAELESVIHV